MKKLILASLSLILLASFANASIIPSLTGGPVASGGNFAFNYVASLSGDERQDPMATNGVTCPGPGTRVQCNPTGTFFTIYDFPGFISANVTAANWGVEAQFSGLTPSTISTSIDNPSMVNVTFFYTGPVVHGPVVTSGFQVISSFGTVGNGNFSSQSTKDTGDAIGNTDQLAGPVSVAATPEPGSLLLIGFGLAGVALLRRHQTAK